MRRTTSRNSGERSCRSTSKQLTCISLNISKQKRTIPSTSTGLTRKLFKSLRLQLQTCIPTSCDQGTTKSLRIGLCDARKKDTLNICPFKHYMSPTRSSTSPTTRTLLGKNMCLTIHSQKPVAFLHGIPQQQQSLRINFTRGFFNSCTAAFVLQAHDVHGFSATPGILMATHA